jgi:hypothetical protein
MASLIQEAGFPKGVVNILVGCVVLFFVSCLPSFSVLLVLRVASRRLVCLLVEELGRMSEGAGEAGASQCSGDLSASVFSGFCAESQRPPVPRLLQAEQRRSGMRWLAGNRSRLSRSRCVVEGHAQMQMWMRTVVEKLKTFSRPALLPGRDAGMRE